MTLSTFQNDHINNSLDNKVIKFSKNLIIDQNSSNQYFTGSSQGGQLSQMGASMSSAGSIGSLGGHASSSSGSSKRRREKKVILEI